MGTKLNPGKYDCENNAEPDEPKFTLLARDHSAPQIVRTWANMRARLIREGVKPKSDWPMVDEARDCADQMEAWRRKNR